MGLCKAQRDARSGAAKAYCVKDKKFVAMNCPREWEGAIIGECPECKGNLAVSLCHAPTPIITPRSTKYISKT